MIYTFDVVAKRIDRGTLRPVERLPDGRIRVDAYLTRTGIFDYLNADGTIRRELRRQDHVFDGASLVSATSALVTDDHPYEMVRPDNAKQYAAGIVEGTPRQDDDKVRAPLLIWDAELIEKMESGKVEVSCGYEADIIEEPGEFNGQRYDAVQTNIRYNHVAIVERGRAGRDVRARMDAARMISPMEKQDSVILDAVEKKIGEQAVKISELEAALKTQTERADKAEAARDDFEEKFNAAEKARTDAEASFAERVTARAELEGAAKKLGLEVKPGMSDKEIKVAVVKKIDNKDVGDKSDAYVDARYDAALERAPEAEEAAAEVREVTEVSHNDAEDGPKKVKSARDNMVKRNRNQK